MLAKILRFEGVAQSATNNFKSAAARTASSSVSIADQPQWTKDCGTPRLVLHGIIQRRMAHNWQPNQNAINQQRQKIIPKLVYLHNPWKFIITKLNLYKLKWLWDRDFNETEFIEGSKQAAIVMTDIIRQQSAELISEYTTPVGFQQITRDMLLSRNDTRLQLVRFKKEHLRRAIPMKVATRQNFGRKYAFIDMLFVGLRNTKDFDSPGEMVEINDIIRRMDNELKTPIEVSAVPHRIVFAEIFIRFRRDYSVEVRQKHKFSAHSHTAPVSPVNSGRESESGLSSLPSTQNPAKTGLPTTGRILPRLDDPGWSVSFYKILTFDVLNYDPQPKKY